MSKKTHTQRVAENVWYQVLHDHDEYFTKSWEVFLLRKLKQARFTKQGALRYDAVGKMITLEFPSLHKFWKERMNDKSTT